jgi:hypothetical protein
LTILEKKYYTGDKDALKETFVIPELASAIGLVLLMLIANSLPLLEG